MQEQEVEEFFNKIATDYKSKYTSADAFRHYFFNERLYEAARGFDFSNKKILDIGAGTGNLYDYLSGLEPTIDYYASDIAANMLEQSGIAPNRRFVGNCYEIDFPQKQFDYIFMLGVTTYLTEQEIAKTFDFIHSSLAQNGKAIITFTNQSSLDWKTRKLTKSLLKGFSQKSVLSQDFQIYPKTLAETEKQIQSQFRIDEVRWLNHTIFPFCLALKKISVKVAEKIHQKIKNQSLKNLLSSDFLVVLSKINEL